MIPSPRKILKIPLAIQPVRRLIRARKKKQVTIMMYHGVTPTPLPVYNWCHIPVHEFREQIQFLSATYRVLPLTEVVTRLERRQPLPDYTACVTFDDGFRNVLTTAYPVLTEYRIPFTVFVITGLAETGLIPWPEQLFDALTRTRRESLILMGHRLPLATGVERGSAFSIVLNHLRTLRADHKVAVLSDLLSELGPGDAQSDTSSFSTLTWADIAELASSGLTQFGAHSDTHEILARCSAERMYTEIMSSRAKLHDRLGNAELFAYPNGDYNPMIQQMVRVAGFRAAVTTMHGLNSLDADLYELKRVGIGSGISAWRFETAILGL